MTKKYICDNCGNEIKNNRYMLFLGKEDIDENEVEIDLCVDCKEKLKKIIQDGFN